MIDYLDWQSDLTLEQVFAGAPPFSYPSIVDGLGTLYLSKDPHDNRSVLMLMSDDKVATITPATFNLATRVNEYGGKPYWLSGSSLVFANRSDQCLYRQQQLRSTWKHSTAWFCRLKPLKKQWSWPEPNHQS